VPLYGAKSNSYHKVGTYHVPNPVLGTLRTSRKFTFTLPCEVSINSSKLQMRQIGLVTCWRLHSYLVVVLTLTPEVTLSPYTFSPSLMFLTKPLCQSLVLEHTSLLDTNGGGGLSILVCRDCHFSEEAVRQDEKSASLGARTWC
jgi:hypothetical protein